MGKQDVNLQEWYNTGDMIEVISENPLKFRFASRKNDIINVGGYNVNPLEVEEIISDVEDALYALGENEITSKQIGDAVLDQLAKRNEVAYIRFASVYHEFKTLDDFVKILEQQRQNIEKKVI